MPDYNTTFGGAEVALGANESEQVYDVKMRHRDNATEGITLIPLTQSILKRRRSFWTELPFCTPFIAIGYGKWDNSTEPETAFLQSGL